MPLMRVRWSLRDKTRVLYTLCCLQRDILIGAAKITKIFVRVSCWSLHYGVQPKEILCNHMLQTGATRRQAMMPVGLNRGRILGVSSARPVDNRRQLWRFWGTWFRIGQRTVLFVGWLYCCEIKSDEDRSDSISGVNTGSLIPLPWLN